MPTPKTINLEISLALSSFISIRNAPCNKSSNITTEDELRTTDNELKTNFQYINVKNEKPILP